MPEHLARRQHAAGEIHGDDLVPLVEGKVPQEFRRSTDAGVVDEDVDVTEGVDDLRHAVDDVLLVPQVHRDRESLGAEGLQLRDGRLQVIEIAAGHTDYCAFFREAPRDRPADARAAAGDKGQLVLEPLICHEGPLPVVALVQARPASLLVLV